ncbi:hypothetical protein JGU66_29625 [Myxococcaceae bacterium JPH2]|nr:hypothetical protein [Myxococcaceae bacterium JPH2]
MTHGTLFSTDTVTEAARLQWRVWVADLLDLVSAGLWGWGALRALEHDRTHTALAVAVGLAWLLLSGVGGLTGRTLGRQLLGIQLVRGGQPPGLGRGLARAFTAPLELPMQPVLQRRPLDEAQGVHAETLRPGVVAWLKALVPQLPWVALLAAAAWFIVMPTKQELLKYLGRTLTGWHCCHGTRDVTWECKTSLSRAVRDARRGDPEVSQVVAACPVASERLPK